MKWEVFLPLRTIEKGVTIPLQETAFQKPCQDIQREKGNPFFSITNEQSTVKHFLEAVTSSDAESARAYISKSFIGEIDLTELRNTLEIFENYKFLGQPHLPGKSYTGSVLMFNKNRNSILKLHMVQEPDSYGNWKIYGIEKE